MGNDKKVYINSDGTWGLVCFLATIGAAVYYVQQATGFWEGVVGIIKALVWPAMLMYKVMQMLQM